MALRSVIDIDVNTRQFDAFVQRFQAFQQNAQVNVGVTGVPGGGGGGGGGSVPGTGPGAAPGGGGAPGGPAAPGGGGAAPAGPGGAPGGAAKPQFGPPPRVPIVPNVAPNPWKMPLPKPPPPPTAWADAMERVAKASKEFAKNFHTAVGAASTISRYVIDIAKRFLTISGSLALLSSAAVGFGFLGFNSLARSAAAMRRQAAVAGTDAPGLQAAQAGLGRFGDVPSMLSNLHTLIQDPSQAGALAGRFQDVLGHPATGREDTADLLTKLLPSIREDKRLEDPSTRGMMFHALGIDKLMSQQDFTTLMARNPAEVREQARQTRQIRQQPGMQISDQDLKVFDDFITKIKTAGSQVETTFIKTLGPLAKPLGELTDAFTGLLVSGIKELGAKGGVVEQLLTALTQWVKDLNKPETRESFLKAIRLFIKGLEELTGSIVEIAKVLGLISRTPEEKAAQEKKSDDFKKELGRRALRPQIGPEPMPDPTDDTPAPAQPPVPGVNPIRYDRPAGAGNPLVHPAAYRAGANDNRNPMIQSAAFRPGTSGQPAAPAAAGTNQGPWDKPIPVLPWPLPLPVTIEEGGGGQGTGWAAGFQRASYNTAGGGSQGGEGAGGGQGGGAGGGQENTIPGFAGPNAPPIIETPGDYSWGDVGTRANNPGNLNFAPGQGAVGRVQYTDSQTGAPHTMGAFQTMPEGVAAVYRQLLINQNKPGGMTLAGAMKGYAEHGYVGPLAKELGINPDDKFDLSKLPPEQAAKVLAAIFTHEGRKGSHSVTSKQVMEGVNLARERVAKGKSPTAPVEPPGKRATDEANKQGRDYTQPQQQPVAPPARTYETNARPGGSSVQQATINLRLDNQTGSNTVVSGGQLAA
jgi:hypothetical protein